jgi:hypothetical protein
MENLQFYNNLNYFFLSFKYLHVYNFGNIVTHDSQAKSRAVQSKMRETWTQTH